MTSPNAFAAELDQIREHFMRKRSIACGIFRAAEREARHYADEIELCTAVLESTRRLAEAYAEDAP